MKGRTLAVVVVAAWIATPASLVAHTRKPSRKVVLQLDGTGAVSLWEATVPGRSAALMGALFDTDHDGQFDGDEGRVVGERIITKALNGVRLTWNGQAPSVAAIDSLLERGAVVGRPLTALALAQLAIELGDGGVFELTVEHGGDLDVQVQGLDDWLLVATDRGRLAPDRRGLATPVILRAGESIALVMEQRAGDGANHQR